MSSIQKTERQNRRAAKSAASRPSAAAGLISLAALAVAAAAAPFSWCCPTMSATGASGTYRGLNPGSLQVLASGRLCCQYHFQSRWSGRYSLAVWIMQHATSGAYKRVLAGLSSEPSLASEHCRHLHVKRGEKCEQ